MGGGGGSALLLRLRGFVVLPAPDGWLVDLSRSPTALRASKQVTALLEDAASCQLCRGSGIAHCISFLYRSGKPLIANKIGKDFFSGATRSHFSASEELKE